FPPSYHYTDRGVTLDRYLLPVIAIMIPLVFYALRDVDLFQPISWLALATVAVVSVAGVRDYLVFMDAIWDMAETATENGVPLDRLDAGSGWDGYHLYTVMLDENITKARSPAGSPWWIYFYAKPTDSSYIVATDPNVRRGYAVVEERGYDQWLEDDPVHVYLLRRWFLPYPIRWAGTEQAGGKLLPGTGSETPEARTVVATPRATTVATPASSPVPATSE
ncbi:MAG: hypothetical protein M3173_02750, partial [Chloroflexota bacterium]|nr:hypothetical protein [Chloroflexota bacterium]